jgi:transposase
MGLGEGGRKRAAAMWYLVGLPSYLNLTTALQKLFERKQDSLQRLAAEDKAERMAASLDKTAARPAPSAPETSPLTATEARRQARRARRQSRYEEVIKLHQQGASQVAIAVLVGLDRDTVRRYINSAGFPEIVRPGKRSKLDPYKPYLRARWAEGARNIKHLLAELRERGYRHGETIVYDYLRSMRKQSAQQQAAPASGKKLAHVGSRLSLSAREAAWLFACNPQRLRLAQVVKLDRVRRSEEELATVYQLAQDFRVMVTRRQADVLDRWLTEAKGSGTTELQSLATGILRDFDAVRAALTLPYSNDHVA